MEQITPPSRYPQTKTLLPALRFSPYWRILLMVGALAITITSIWMLSQKAPPPDPFATFSGVFPGQHVDTRRLEAQGYTCTLETYPSVAEMPMNCSQDLPTGSFSNVTVTVWDGNVKQLMLIARENTVSIGDLMFFWGHPRIHQYSSWGQLDWPRGEDLNLTVSYTGRYSPFRPVGSIMFRWMGNFES